MNTRLAWVILIGFVAAVTLNFTLIRPAEARTVKVSFPPEPMKGKFEVLNWELEEIKTHGNKLVVEGVVRNISRRTFFDVSVIAIAMDGFAHFVSVDDGYLKSSFLESGHRAVFWIVVKDDARIDELRLFFLYH